MAPTATLVSLEAKTVLTALEQLLRDLMSKAVSVTDTRGVGASIAEASAAVAKELSSGNYPQAVLYIAMHQREYVRASEIIGALLIAAVRAQRATATNDATVQ